MTDSTVRRIGVLGAGSIGCYIGGRLAHGGAAVTLLGRPSLAQDLLASGLHLTSIDGLDIRLPLSEQLRCAIAPEALAGCEVVLVATKGGDTGSAATSLLPHLAPGTTVVSLQNGLRNVGRIQDALPGSLAVPGMVSFNVSRTGPGAYHQGTTGPVIVGEEAEASGLTRALEAAGLIVETSPHMPGIMWGKLIFNLNNALNALSGLPLREQLKQRAFRRLLSTSMGEALAVLAAAGITPRALGPIGPAIARRILLLPNWAFFRLAKVQLDIDAQARSSMQDDLRRHRTTEIDDLQGEVVRLGEQLGVPTPLNRRIVSLIRAAETAAAGPPGLTAAEITGP